MKMTQNPENVIEINNMSNCLNKIHIQTNILI